MKGTFDKETIEFSVSFYDPYKENEDFNISFDDIYGLGPSDSKDSIFSLKADSLNKDNGSVLKTVTFNKINTDESLTYEDAVEKYIKDNYLEFNKLEMNVALCFLERYCIDYEETLKIRINYKNKTRL